MRKMKHTYNKLNKLRREEGEGGEPELDRANTKRKSPTDSATPDIQHRNRTNKTAAKPKPMMCCKKNKLETR